MKSESLKLTIYKILEEYNRFGPKRSDYGRSGAPYCTTRTQIYNVGAHAAALRAVGPREGRGAELQRGVLLADGRVLQRDVRHFLVAADQEGRLSVDVEDRQRLVAFEWVEPKQKLNVSF